MKIIDKRKEIQALKEKYGPLCYQNPEFMKELAEIWGAKPNKHGVLSSMKETVVNAGMCKGEIRFSKTDKGYWLIGISAISSNSGEGYAPSVSSTIGYESRQDARLAGIEQLSHFFENVTKDTGTTNSEKNRADAKKALQILTAEKTPQLKLF